MARLALLALLLATGCKATGNFACETSDQCRLGGSLGMCESTGYCSFTDGTCPSGSRYDTLAGGGLAGTCVGGSTSDAADGPDGPPGCTLWQAHYFDPCALPAPPGSIHLDAAGSPYKYDTTNNGGSLIDKNGQPIAVSSSVLVQAGGTDAALWTVTDLELATGVELDVVGDKPLIIAAWDHITVTGTLDAGSHRGVRDGAGANPSGCDAAAAGVDGASGTSGGGGGGFGGDGGAGGLGDANATAPAMPLPGGIGGGARVVPDVAVGGCSGASSGKDIASMAFAIGGASGGGIVLAAQLAITVTGKVLAGGAGGGGDNSASTSFGGGGGGSGGLIAFDAATVDVSGAVIAANGGGGGAGGNIAGTGGTGNDGAASGNAAAGGAGVAAQGSNGGAGSFQNQLAGATVTDTTPAGGGGGGGGGAGYILHWTPSFAQVGATISPPAIQP